MNSICLGFRHVPECRPNRTKMRHKQPLAKYPPSGTFPSRTMPDNFTNIPPNDLQTPEEIAAFLKVDPKTVFNWAKIGIIPEAFRVGKTARFSLEAVKASLKMNRPDLGNSKRSVEDIVRLAFTMIDHELFPPPSWMLFEENMDPRDTDYARRMADQHRKAVEAQNSTTLKLAYFQGVLDWAAMMEAEGETVTGCEEPMAT